MVAEGTQIVQTSFNIIVSFLLLWLHPRLYVPIWYLRVLISQDFAIFHFCISVLYLPPPCLFGLIKCVWLIKVIHICCHLFACANLIVNASRCGNWSVNGAQPVFHLPNGLIYRTVHLAIYWRSVCELMNLACAMRFQKKIGAGWYHAFVMHVSKHHAKMILLNEWSKYHRWKNSFNSAFPCVWPLSEPFRRCAFPSFKSNVSARWAHTCASDCPAFRTSSNKARFYTDVNRAADFCNSLICLFTFSTHTSHSVPLPNWCTVYFFHGENHQD